jgi:hypothetical protein
MRASRAATQVAQLSLKAVPIDQLKNVELSHMAAILALESDSEPKLGDAPQCVLIALALTEEQSRRHRASTSGRSAGEAARRRRRQRAVVVR